MEKSNAIAIISSRKSVSQPGAYELKATNVSEYDGKFIVNFNGMTPYHLSEAKRLIKDDSIENNVQEAVNQSLTASLRPTDYIPSKGEIVKAVVDLVTTKNGVTGLFIVSVSELKARTAAKVSFDLDEELEIATEEPQLIAKSTKK